MISVIMTTYNTSMFVAPAIESILNQSFEKFELIIVDDGSTDNTLEIVRRYAERDTRIQVIQTEHGGASNARNVGIQASKYPWIAIMDADDISLPNRLEKQITAAKANSKIVALGAAVHHMNSKGEIFSVSRLGPETEEAFYRQRQEGHVVNLNHPTALLNKGVVLKVGGYNPQFKAAQDLELLDRMAEYGPVIALREPLALYRVHSQSISMQRFFLQRHSMRYVRARHLAKLAGKREPSLEDYFEECRQRPLFSRLSKHLKTLGIFYYRKAGLFVCEKQYLQACFYIGMSAALNPKYSIPRVWKQVLSPETRQAIDKVKQ
ncbi:MAG: glycosyl transferase family 2 [Cyanobacteria bacterium QH_9_48_43]|nr:MAG: glycosyl transferase family 2 [Cyanobacteria bacterium QH_9_48_43]